MVVDPQRVAYHEAAHAVAALALGLGVARVAIDVDAKSLGQTDLVPDHDVGPPWRIVHRRVMQALAGGSAETVRSGRYDDQGAASDEKNACRIASIVLEDLGDRRRFIDGLRDAAVDVLRSHWSAVERVAGALLEQRSLTGAEVERLAGFGPEASCAHT